MTKLMLIVALMTGSAAIAHELDGEQTVSVQQIEKAQELPGMIVVRTSKADPSKVEVVHLKEKAPVGTNVSNLKFEQVALNAEVAGIAYDSSNELDARSSTSSWSFGVYYRPTYGYNGYRRPYYGGYNNYGSSSYYYRRTTVRYYDNDYDNCYGYNDGCGGNYYPSYRYSGYNYNYRPYYGYSDNYYNYDCYDWY